MKYSLKQGKAKLQKLLRSGQTDKAVVLGNKLIEKYRDIDLLLILMRLYLRMGDAATCTRLRQLVHSDFKDTSNAHLALARLYKEHGLLQQANEEYQASINRYADETSYQELVTLYIHNRLYNDAIHLCGQALKRYPDSSRLHLMLGSTYLSLQDIDNAERHFSESHRLSADNKDAIVGLANIKFLQREHSQAATLLRPILDSKHPAFSAILVYSQIASSLSEQDEAIRQLKATADDAIAEVQRPAKHFALGRLYDENKEYEDAFRHYALGNTLSRQKYDRAQHENYFTAIRRNYSDDRIAALSVSDESTSSRQIFIVGMPRSGTSLLEQILASHSDVYGAGELNTLDTCVKSLPGRFKLQSAYPDNLDTLGDDALRQITTDYTDHIGVLDESHRFVTDKMPDNFQYIGLIRILFPSAKILHCNRDPIDTCLSCYFQQFTGHYPFAYDLSSLSHYYRCYEDLMEHWYGCDTLSIHNVTYEDMVRDNENTVRDLLDYCGLEFEDNCLKYDRSTRAITTSSAHQASKPLYDRSIQRWKNYEPWIKPLIDAFQ